LERGVSPRLTGQTSAGIGAAMRIAPVALYFNGDPDGMFDAVMNASLMTHRDIRSLAGAMAVAHAVRRLAAGAPRDPSILLWLAADVAREENRIADRYADRVSSLDLHRRSLSRSVAHAESLLDLPRERALATLVEEANRHGAEPACRRATMGFPPACIPTCLYLLMTTDSLEEALIEVVNLGGDADTTGAILGALAGAHYGVAAIPDRWLDGLQNRGAIDFRARALARRSAEGFDIPDLIGTEHALSAQESACRERLLILAQNGGDLGANRRH
ncbi:MAG TPA: ADP-ribosylglycohydrolase family protein, partial [Isosphaeraceae bacterium]|nr:ADP-ribosylglycohydrolase family protein [Isosphaeraceae bacterium]